MEVKVSAPRDFEDTRSDNPPVYTGYENGDWEYEPIQTKEDVATSGHLWTGAAIAVAAVCPPLAVVPAVVAGWKYLKRLAM